MRILLILGLQSSGVKGVLCFQFVHVIKMGVFNNLMNDVVTDFVKPYIVQHPSKLLFVDFHACLQYGCVTFRSLPRFAVTGEHLVNIIPLLPEIVPLRAPLDSFKGDNGFRRDNFLKITH